MSKQDVIKALNQDVTEELAAIIQYTWHHFMAEGMESPAIVDLFQKTAMDEMKHLEMLAERIVYLGGEPPTTLGDVRKGGDLRKMVQDDLEGEDRAISLYQQHIELAEREKDYTTRHILEEILEDEEGHADQWETALGVRKLPSSHMGGTSPRQS